MALELLLYPISYHANLQRLGLVPARPFLPNWMSLNPFSTMSPLTPLSIFFDPFNSITDCAKAFMTSPLMLTCAEHLFELWLYASINEAVDASVIRPDNPDIADSDKTNKNRAATILGLRRKSPRFVRKVIGELLSTLGWGTPCAGDESDQPRLSDFTDAQTIEVGDTTITNVAPLELSVSQAQGGVSASDPDVDAFQRQVAIADGERPTTPITPLASELQYDEDDPRIRITNREGIVEMEVRLPSRILSTHTEIADAFTPSQAQQVRSYSDTGVSSNRPFHRVSELSMGPSKLISSIVKAQVVGLVVLPFKLVLLRLIASHYLASGHGGDQAFSRNVVPLPGVGDLSWRVVGIQASRLALCNMLEVAMDLTLWGLQYAVTIKVGKTFFGWGTL